VSTVDIHVIGGEDIALVARAVRRLGTDRVIVNNMAKEIRRAVPPVRAAVRANAVAILPRRGGLGAWVAKTRVTARIRRSASNAGITFVGGKNSKGKRSDLKRMDAGQTRHPTFGHRPWVAQSVTPGFFTHAVTEEGATAFREAVVVAVDNAAREVLG
jgi:hypothetical protein